MSLRHLPAVYEPIRQRLLIVNTSLLYYSEYIRLD